MSIRVRNRFFGKYPTERFPYAYQQYYVKRNGKWVLGQLLPLVYVPSKLYPYSKYENTLDELHPGPPYKTGGPFDSVKLSSRPYVIMPGITCTGIVGASKIIIWGSPILITSPFKIRESLVDSTVDKLMTEAEEEVGDLYSLGRGAYEKFSPLKPRVDMGQFFAEFGEIPRMLRATAKFFRNIWRSMGGAKTWFGPKHVADEWLNTQFGWVPFLSTLSDLIRTTQNVSSYIERLRRFNGKWEKRGGRVAKVNTTSEYDMLHNVLFSADSRFSISTNVKTSVETKFDAWYEAKYRYWIPELRKPGIPLSVLNQMYGMRVSPALIWELIPWSWLIDWFADIGRILQAADERQFGQLVSKDGYLMGHLTRRFKTEANFHISSSSDSAHSYCTTYSMIDRKERIQSTPYGFGVHFTDLSPWKVSILAALGVSKSSLHERRIVRV